MVARRTYVVDKGVQSKEAVVWSVLYHTIASNHQGSSIARTTQNGKRSIVKWDSAWRVVCSHIQRHWSVEWGACGVIDCQRWNGMTENDIHVQQV